ncbi:hypothetical protein [Caldilinea sp.]|nr:hypothetical protein [Caldilinea sp.]
MSQADDANPAKPEKPPPPPRPVPQKEIETNGAKPNGEKADKPPAKPK